MFCKNCGKEISEDAITCPNCGAYIGEKKQEKKGPNGCLISCLGCLGLLIIGFFAMFIITGIIGAMSVSDTNTTTTEQSSQPTQQKDKEQSMLYKAVNNHSNPFNFIENKVADDAVDQYNIAKRQGDKIQVCVQAGLVSAAYLQAKDEPNYKKWKAIEKQDCKVAGMPF